MQYLKSRRQRLPRRPCLIALTLKCEEITVSKFGDRRFQSRIATDFQGCRELIKIAFDRAALKCKRDWMMAIAHQQIQSRT